MNRYAANTAFGYCAGCADLCENAVENPVPIGDVMRCLVYDYAYDDRKTAIARFRHPPHVSGTVISHTDFSKAEKVCPQQIPISAMMKKAWERFGRPPVI